MAKQKSNVIALEIEAFEKKVHEFQRYLSSKDINEIYDDTVRAKEIDIQLKLTNAIPFLLEQVAKLREQEVGKKLETYGDKEMGGLAQDFLKNK